MLKRVCSVSAAAILLANAALAGSPSPCQAYVNNSPTGLVSYGQRIFFTAVNTNGEGIVAVINSDCIPVKYPVGKSGAVSGTLVAMMVLGTTLCVAGVDGTGYVALLGTNGAGYTGFSLPCGPNAMVYDTVTQSVWIACGDAGEVAVFLPTGVFDAPTMINTPTATGVAYLMANGTNVFLTDGVTTLVVYDPATLALVTTLAVPAPAGLWRGMVSTYGWLPARILWR